MPLKSDIRLPAAQELAAIWLVPKVNQDHRPILEDPSIDAVAICSSTDTDAQIIIEAAQAGKHIALAAVEYDQNR